MIRIYKHPEDFQQMKALVYNMPAENYFICMAIEEGLSAYRDIYLIFEDDTENDLQACLFYRKSGNLQIAVRSGLPMLPSDELRTFLMNAPFGKLIVSRSVFEKVREAFDEIEIEEGAVIQRWIDREAVSCTSLREDICMKLKNEDLPQVEALYKQVFHGYANQVYMAEKLREKRGIGFVIHGENGILSVAQTDFDNHVIVGVATEPLEQGKGLASACMLSLLCEIKEEAHEVYLQVENQTAMKLYEKLGFRTVDFILHVTKTR